MTCYLCGSGQCTRRKGQVRDNKNANINQCDTCGLVFLTGVKREDVEVFYQDGGMHGCAEKAVPVDRWLREAAHDDIRRFNNLREQITNKSVLDFGCGTGGFLQNARDVAESVTGVELEERLRPHFQSTQLEVCADVGSLDTKRTFDVITAFHVIEHLPDPRHILELLKGRLTPGGQIIVEVPSADDALLTLYENEPFSRFTYWSCHLYLFNASTLDRLARQAGLRVVYVKYIQRYPLSNHLHWLATGKPGGHKIWGFLDSSDLSIAYENSLARIGRTDTILASLII